MLLLPQAVAYEWILRYLDNLNDMIGEVDEYGRTDPITLDELLSTAESHLDGGWGDYIVRGGSFEGVSFDIELLSFPAPVKPSPCIKETSS